MLLETEFDTFTKLHGLKGTYTGIAEIAWEAAERAMQNKPVQVPVLLKQQKQFKSNDLSSLTRSELQSLSSIMNVVLSIMEDNKQLLKFDTRNMYYLAEEGTEEGEYYFRELNRLRNLQRSVKSRYNKIAEIQRKLKSVLSKE